MKRLLALLTILTVVGACGPSRVRQGQRLFAGFDGPVDDRATLETGEFVPEDPDDVIEFPFGGNGRACGSCHMPGDNFAILSTSSRYSTLTPISPLYCVFIHFVGCYSEPPDRLLYPPPSPSHRLSLIHHYPPSYSNSESIEGFG